MISRSSLVSPLRDADQEFPLAAWPLPDSAPVLCAAQQERFAVHEVSPESARWCSLARSHPEATVFHQPEWANVLRATYGLEPHYFVLSRDGGQVSGLPFFRAGGPWRRRLISLPFSDAAGPLLAQPQDAAPLMAAVEEAARQWHIDHVELRGGPQPPAGGFERAGDFCTFVLDLEPELPALRAAFQKSTTQRSLRIAERSPLTVRQGQDEEDLRSFHRLNLLTRRRHGVPPQPFRLFRNIWRGMAPAGMTALLLAEVGERPVAGMVLLRFRDTAYYKYGASDPAELRLRPNHLLMWRAIEWAREQGCRRLDLGRTYLGNEGLMRFKHSWGARQVQLDYWLSPPPRGRSLLCEGSPGYELITRHWRRLPLWATELGSLFYKMFA